MKSYHLIILFSVTVLSCSTPAKKNETTLVNESTSKNEVTLTDEQYKSIQIELGSAEMMSLSGSIKANGMLDIPPQNLVSISAPLGGFVKSTELLQGMHVKQGQIVVVLEHPDYIQLQQDYLESKNQLEFLDQEYDRQQTLSSENVSAMKA